MLHLRFLCLRNILFYQSSSAEVNLKLALSPAMILNNLVAGDDVTVGVTLKLEGNVVTSIKDAGSYTLTIFSLNGDDASNYVIKSGEKLTYSFTIS